MTALVRGSWLLARASLPRMVLSRRFVVCALLAAVPVLVAFLAARLSSRVGPGELATHVTWMLLLQIVVPLTSLVAGVSVVAEEIEDRTISYVFTRPIPRAALLFGRLAAAIAWIVPLLVAAAWLVLEASESARGKGEPLDPSTHARLFAAVATGAVVYTSVFAAAGALLRHPMIVGLAYAFAVEGFLANLPGKNQMLALQHYLRSLVASTHQPAWARVEGFASASYDTPAMAWTVLACVGVGAVAIAAVGLTRREIELTA